MLFTAQMEEGLLRYGPYCVVLSLLVIASCRNESAREAPTGSGSSERYILDEGTPPISAIRGYTSLRGDTALIADERGEIFLLIADRRVGRIGARGSGPCEYQALTSYTVAGDTVFVLDHRQGKLVGYSVKDGSCLSELVAPDLARFSALIKVGPWFYFTVTSYNTSLPPESVLLYRMSLSGEFTPLDLRKSDLDADLLMMPIKAAQLRQIRERKGEIYFLLPLSHKVWRYNVNTGQVWSFDLVHESAGITEYANSTDFQAVAAAIGEVEMEIDLFLLDDYIAISSRRPGGWMRSLYSYTGELNSREEVTGKMVFEEEGIFYNVVSGDEDDDTRPFRIKPIELRAL